MQDTGRKLSKAEVPTVSFHAVLLQRRWWRNAAGQAVRRRDMNINYKLNTLAHLLRNAESIVLQYTNAPVFSSAPDEVWAELEQMQRQPEHWMMNTPMWRALLQDVMAFADIGPEDIGLEEAPNWWGQERLWIRQP